MKIEKLSKYLDDALEFQNCVVLESFEDYANSVNGDNTILENYIKTHQNKDKRVDYWTYFTIVLTFVHNEKEAREFVKRAIEEAHDPDYESIQRYAEEVGYKDAYEVLSGKADGYGRFNWSKQGYLIDTVEI